MDSSKLDKLKCDKCKNYLSHFPIYTGPLYKNVCGRCFFPTLQESQTRNEVYEIASQFLSFPCRFKENGCDAEMFPENIPKHEEECLYKTVKCPVSSCSFEKSLPEIVQHCHNKHLSLILKQGEFQINLSNSQQEKLVEYEDILFMILSKFDQTANLLEFAVCYFSNESVMKDLFCHIIIKHGKLELSSEISLTDFKEPCYTKIYTDNFVKTESTDSKLFATISFDNSFENRKSDNEMLSAIKCSLCSYYAIPPIYHCSRKPSLLICSECISKHVDQSINCAVDKNKSSDSNLDKIASCLNYPCKYQNNGCTFTSRPDQIKKHFTQCLYRHHDCPVKDFVKCDWTGFAKNVNSHILNLHQDMISSEQIINFPVPIMRKPKIQKTGEITLMSRRRFIQSHRFNPDLHCKIIKVANFLFRLTYTKIEEKFCWELQLIGCCQKQFSYDIEIIDAQKGKSMSKKQMCSQIGRKEELFRNEDSFCSFEKSQIEKFISEQQLRFTVNVCEKIKKIV